MKNLFIRLVALLGAAMAVHGVSAQEPQKHEAELRFDQAQREELADEPSPAVTAGFAAAGRPFAYKLNRKRTSEAVAYDAVTLWNVRKVKIRDRRMKLSDSTRREKVRLLKFFIERDRKKGARPHLLGNVAGYTWSNAVYDEAARTWRTVPKHIATYTLRDEYDSVRRSGGDVSMFKVPEELWRRLSPKAVYMLDGVRVPGSVFQFIDGLFLRTLEVHTDRGTMARYDTDRGGCHRGCIPRPNTPGGLLRPALDDRGVAENLPYRRFFGGRRSAHALFLHAARRGRANLRAGG